MLLKSEFEAVAVFRDSRLLVIVVEKEGEEEEAQGIKIT